MTIDRIQDVNGDVVDCALILTEVTELPVPPATGEGAFWLKDGKMMFSVEGVADKELGVTPLLFGARSVAASTVTRYLLPGGGGSSTAQASERSMRVSKSGTLQNMYLQVDEPGGNGNDVVYTLFKNGVSTGLTITVASTDSAGADTTNTVDVVTGDRVAIQVTKGADVGLAPRGVSIMLELV